MNKIDLVHLSDDIFSCEREREREKSEVKKNDEDNFGSGLMKIENL